MNARERKEKLDKRYGWLASLISSTIISGFMILKAIFQGVFNGLKVLASYLYKV